MPDDQLRLNDPARYVCESFDDLYFLYTYVVMDIVYIDLDLKHTLDNLADWLCDRREYGLAGE